MASVMLALHTGLDAWLLMVSISAAESIAPHTNSNLAHSNFGLSIETRSHQRQSVRAASDDVFRD